MFAHENFYISRKYTLMACFVRAPFSIFVPHSYDRFNFQIGEYIQRSGSFMPISPTPDKLSLDYEELGRIQFPFKE